MQFYAKVIKKVIKKFANERSYDDKLDLQQECHRALLEYATSVHSERDAYIKCRDAVRKYLYRKNGPKVSATEFAREISLDIPDNLKEADLATAVESNIVRKLDEEIVLEALRDLPWYEKVIIKWMLGIQIEASTAQEIAEELGRSESFVRNHYKRGIERLRKNLKEKTCQQI